MQYMVAVTRKSNQLFIAFLGFIIEGKCSYLLYMNQII